MIDLDVPAHAHSPARHLRTDDSLRVLEEELAQAFDIKEAAYDAASRPSATNADTQRWAGLSRRFSELLEDRDRERRLLQRREQDALVETTWAPETRALEEELLAVYGKRGVQYRALCAMVAPLMVKLRHCYDGEMRLEHGEQLDVIRTLTGLIAQLQRHTESVKSESTDMGAVIAILRIVEKRLLGQPKVFREIVDEARTIWSPGGPDDEQQAALEATHV